MSPGSSMRGGAIRGLRWSLIHERNRAISEPEVAEATLFINGSVLKASEASEDMYASIDRMSDKLERQVKRYRGRQIDRWQGQLKNSSGRAGSRWRSPSWWRRKRK